MTARAEDWEKWIDVTVPIHPELVHYPGDPGIGLKQVKHVDRGDPATVSELVIGVHTGTHVDAPVHFISKAPGVDTIAIDALIGPARVLDLGDIEACTANDLVAHDIQPGERLLLRTTNSTRCWNAPGFVPDYAHLTPSAAMYLAERGTRMIGIDYLSIGRGKTGPEVHRILLEAGVVIVEGLDLSQVAPGHYDVVCLPLKIKGCDGAPARVAVRRRDRVNAAAYPGAEGRKVSVGPTRDLAGDTRPRAAEIMRAVAVDTKQKAVRLVERPKPRAPEGTEVLLRTLEVGICGTDREICAFHYGTPPPGTDELVIGHEALAEVVEVGPDASWFRPGQLVVPTVRRPCANRRCAACRQERQDFCSTGEFSERGIVRADGFLCEFFSEDERFLVPVPDVLREVAVLVEPLSVAVKGAEMYRAAHDRLGFYAPVQKGLVVGAGPVGLLAAMTLRATDFETHVFSREQEDSPRADLVRAIGANYISAERTPVERLPERIGKVDVAFEAVGVPEVAFGAQSSLAPNGVFILSGVPAPRDPVQANLSRWMADLVLNNQLVFGTVNAGRSTYEASVRRLEQFMTLFPDAVRKLIRRVPLDQALDVLAQKRGIKNVVALEH